MALPVAIVVDLLILVLSAVAGALSSGPHIADLNILLPPLMTNPVQYRLLGSDGCFSWSWDHHDLLSVQPEYNGSIHCSTSAILMSMAPYSHRKETAVYANDLRTGTIIRCKVIIDKIFKIKIFHQAVKIDLDELATMRIRAFDDEENLFSSLVGLPVSWELIPKSLESNDIHHLIHVPLKETPLSDCVSGFCGDLNIQVKLEEKGLGADLFVVKGVEIGHEIVKAKLLEPTLEHVEDEVTITIAEAMSLDPPSPVFVTVGAVIYYRLKIIHQNSSRVIELPSLHHQWSVQNSSVARVDSMMGTVHALQMGMTNVIVEDVRVYGHLQTSALHVVLPEKLSLFLVPVTSSFDLIEGVDPIHSANVWYVFSGQTYIINMKVFSKGPDVNEILVTKDTDLKLEGNNFDFWDIMPVPTNATEKYGWKNSRLFKPYAVGEGVLTAFLFYLSETKEESLKAVQKVAVCRQVKLSIREKVDSIEVIRIPWAPGVYQQAQLTAVGGCGKLLWLSSDDSTVSVSASGLLLARRPGRSTVKVVSAFDLLNYDEVVVEIMIPSSMNVLPFYPVEAEVGTELTAAVTLKTFDGNLFYQCDAFNSFIRWSVVSKSKTFKVLNATGNICEGNMLTFTESYKQSYGQPCAWACLLPHGTGRAMLHATFSIESHSPLYSVDGPFILETAFPIAAYTPLLAYQAGDGNNFGGYWIDLQQIDNFFEDSCSTGLDELYLVPGSAMDVRLCGGPDRWDQHVKYVETVEVVSEQDAYVRDGIQVQKKLSTGRSYQIVCVSLGKFKLLFSQGNLVGVDHPIASIAKLELFIVCSFPSSITIITNQPANTHDIIEAAAKADRGPDLVRTSPIIVANGCTIRIAAVGLHSKIKAFANSSSLCLSWELVGCEDLAYWSENETCKSSNNINWERSLVLRNTSGLCTIRAGVTGFSDTVRGHFFRKEYLQLESLKSMLTDAFHLQLVTSLRVMPESVLLIFDPEAKVNLSISGGTCFLDAVTNDTKVAQISVTDCSHLLLSPKGLGVALVTIRDIGLSPPAAAYALAKVSNVEWIRIVCEEEITLMEGTIRDFELIAGSDDGSIFDSSQYAFLQIHIHLVDRVLQLFDNNISSISTVGLKFSIRAAAVGITTFYASVKQRGAHERLSQIVKVEVYKPLEVYPDYIYLTPGASYVLTAKGGPIIGGFVEFASLDEETAVVHSSSGKLSAIFTGNAVIRAAVYGKAGNLICEAFGRVEVGIPSQMILSSQSGKLCIGCKMPIYPSISQGSLFSFYELCEEYEWMVDNEKVVELEDARILSSDTEEPCYSDHSYVGFINTLFGRSSGTAEVSISFSCDFQLSGTTKTVHYAASKTLTVMSDPPLALGMPVTWVLPPSYMTSDLLPGSMESYGSLDVHYRGKGITYSVLRTCESKQHPITVHGGKIKTGNVNDLACIQGKDQTTERIEIASCIRVSEVAQVRVSVAKSPFHSAYIGVNGRLELVINYCDELGYSFTEANGAVPFDFEINRPDVVSVQMPDAKNITSEKIFLQARSQGRALARILINHNPEKADFILISVGAQLYPQNPVLNVGQSINFSIIGDVIGGHEQGQWFCSNESILSINKKSGEARAFADGRTQVFFQGSHFKLQTMVAVMNLNQIFVDSPSETLTNTQFPTKGYMFPVRVSVPSGYKFDNSEDENEVPFNCWVDPPFLGYAKPWRHGVGDSYCLFFPYLPKHLHAVFSKMKVIRSNEINNSEGYLYVSVIASLKEIPHVSGFAHALFVGGFSVEVEKINLTRTYNQSRIIVTGNTDLEVYWNSKDSLLVSLIKKEGGSIGGLVEYEVKVLKGESFRDKVVFVLPVTGQKAEIEVSYENGTSASSPARISITWSAIAICAIILIMTVFIFVKLLEIPSRTASSSTAPSASATIGPSSPQPASAPSNLQFSPRTPPPFHEYVRRTIDETPYYVRNRRRRFDPQHTY